MNATKVVIVAMLFVALCLADASSTPRNMRNSTKSFRVTTQVESNNCVVENVRGQINVYFYVGRKMNKGGMLTFKEKMEDSDLEMVTAPEGVYKIRRLYTIGSDRIEFFEYQLDEF